MQRIAKGLIVLAAVAFLLAVVEALAGMQFGRIAPEGFSRASSNLSLIAIALALCFERGPAAPSS